MGRGLVQWFLHNHVAANIIMATFIVGGWISATHMRTETFPAVDPRLIAISVVYPGASPYEIADSITSRVEEALIGIEGVERIESTASEGLGLVRVELTDFANANDTYNEVETAVNGLIAFPPADAERPVISKVRLTPNVMTLALHGELPQPALRYWTDIIEEDLRQLEGVALTALRGVKAPEISIEIPSQALRRYNLSLAEVSARISAFSSNIPAGTLETARGDVVIRVQEKRYSGQEFENVVLRTLADGSQLTVGDVGVVVDRLADARLISRFNGEPAALIDVKRSETEDTLKVATTVKDYLNSAKLPTGLELSIVQDETVNLKDRISLMLRNAILGFALVFLILLLFLDLKLAFWVSAAIPISFLGGLLLIDLLGYSINMISLFALIVVLGIVVDDGIVTGESIFEAQAQGLEGGASEGVRQVIAPVGVGVATTMAAFAPLAFSTGTFGQIIKVIPVVVICILLVSLIEAFFILPSHLARPTRWSRGIVARIRDRFDAWLARWVERQLLPVTNVLMRFRYATLAAFVAIVIVTAGLVQAGIVRFVFFPDIEGDQVIITATLPQGTPFATTEKTLLAIEAAALAVRDEIDRGADGSRSVYENITTTIGDAPNAGPSLAGGAGEVGANLGQVRVELAPSRFREVSSRQIEADIRTRIKDLPNIEQLEYQSSPIGDEPDIAVDLSHPLEETLIEAAATLTAQLKQLEGTLEVTDSFEQGKTEFVFELTPAGLAAGLTGAELGQQLRAAFFGLEVTRFQRAGNEVIVYVRLPKAERESLRELETLRISLPDGRQAPLSQVAVRREQTGYAQINTVNGRRVVTVTSDVDISATTPGDVTAALQTELLPQLQARYPQLDYEFAGETREQSEDLGSLLRNMAIALMLIFVLLGSLLKSYLQPFIIMAAIPFGLVGAVLGHFFLGYDLTFISLFGMVALMGVVVNDSVVLMDYINIKLNEGLDLIDAIARAVERRFRPILLTTLSTFLGLLPMLLERSLQAKFLIPMVVSLTMGILFATVIILFLVPCLVLVADDIQRLGRRARQRLRPMS